MLRFQKEEESQTLAGIMKELGKKWKKVFYHTALIFRLLQGTAYTPSGFFAVSPFHTSAMYVCLNKKHDLTIR